MASIAARAAILARTRIKKKKAHAASLSVLEDAAQHLDTKLTDAQKRCLRKQLLLHTPTQFLGNIIDGGAF